VSVELTFGGLKRTFRIELGAAPKFEAATGMGALSLYKALHERTVTTTQLAEVLRVAFQVNGASFTTEEIFKMIGVEGLIKAYVVAELIIMQLFDTPDEVKADTAGKKSKATASRPTASH
jgi:hypothetical protein